ncbi:hypothetical protein POPTR_005G189150v4 [Populus trichocarpa]|uniref:Uncharacterized protein n=1 Tax=Populus trichocarpa TaxID=3694 RepID=A0ACC0T156_POPTR|nr:hypothetical protein POPTR_005G189150v4 [Populus trichocarpa]
MLSLLSPNISIWSLATRRVFPIWKPYPNKLKSQIINTKVASGSSSIKKHDYSQYSYKIAKSQHFVEHIQTF